MNPLARPLVDALRLARRRAHDAGNLGDALHVAVEMIASQNGTIAGLRRQNANLRAQIRALFTGLPAAERQALEDEDLERDRLPAQRPEGPGERHASEVYTS